MAGEERGAIVLLVAIALVPLLAFVGLAVDGGQAFAVESRLIQAVDAAALAGGKLIDQPERRTADVDNVLAANFPDGTLGATLTDHNSVFDDDNGRVTVTASATFNTSFMRIFGWDTLTVSTQTVVATNERGMELVLVMDNTGSMYDSSGSDSKIETMKSAAHDLVDILYGERTRSAIPRGATSSGSGSCPTPAPSISGRPIPNWLADPAAAAAPYGNASGASWRGCVEAEAGELDQREDVTVGTLNPYLFPPRNFNPYATDPPQLYTGTRPLDESAATNTTSNRGVGPNLGCGPSLTPMQRSKTNVLDAINRMAAWHRGGTATNLGLVWGWRMLSPNWRATWQGWNGTQSSATDMSSDLLPLDYGTEDFDKVAVILTDGVNQNHTCRDGYCPYYNNTPDYSGFGMAEDNRLGLANPYDAGQWAAELDARTLDICTAMKAQGILLYTITFKVSSESIKNTFRACASDPTNYFDDGSTADLRRTFRQIAEELRKLRIAR